MFVMKTEPTSPPCGSPLGSPLIRGFANEVLQMYKHDAKRK